GALRVDADLDCCGLAELIRVRRDCGATTGVIRLRRCHGGQTAPGYCVLAKEFFSPVPKQNQGRRNRIEPAALRHEHGQRDAFPRDRPVGDVCRCALIIQKLPRLEKLETGYSAVEQETCNREAAAPPVESVESCEERNQTDPT